jgi:L-alanine-DL-glutamate epimerase-like enolase superfamily enzyme
MRISRLETFVIGDGRDIDPDKGGVEPLACVRIHTDEGLSGLAEVFRVPPGVVQATVGGSGTHFGRLFIGQEITHPERLWQHAWDALMHTNRRGWEIIVLGALDVAVWDIYGQMLDRPVWELLGGVQRGPFQTPAGERAVVTPYCTLVSDVWGGEPMFVQQVRRAEQLAGRGYKAFKIEPMMSSPGDVVELARRFRAALGSKPTLMVDVGYLFKDVPTAVLVCRQLEEFDVYFFETPFPVDSFVPYAELAGRTSIPLAAGEHGVTQWEFLDMMDRGRISILQPYVTTCGGMTEAKRIVEHARGRGALVCPGNWSTQILGAASVQLAAYSPITPFIELAPAEVYDSPLRRELQNAGFPIRDGVIELPDRAGIGYQLPAEVIKRFAL